VLHIYFFDSSNLLLDWEQWNEATFIDNNWIAKIMRFIKGDCIGVVDIGMYRNTLFCDPYML
jgi:hypothetical protein